MSDALPPAATVPCPGCGVAVSAGYPRCPKCHGVMPRPSTSRVTARGAVAGGSSVEDARRAGVGWVVGGVAGAAAILGVAWWMLRDDGRARAAAAPDAASAEEGAEGDDGEAADPEAEAPRARAAAPVDDGPDLPRAMRALDDALRVERLWSKLRRERDVVVVESAQCDDPAMAPVVEAHLEALAAAGASAVRCLALHGAVMFERGL